MDIFLRIIAIIIEVLILGVITYTVLNGARLTVFDLGVKAKYGKAVAMALIAVGIILIVFFIAHLDTFYPAI
jgi:hypothetical protein